MTWPLFELLLQASLMTIFVSGLSILIGLGVAILLSAMRMSGNLVLVNFARIFISFFRGVPLLVQAIRTAHAISFSLTLYGFDLSRKRTTWREVGMMVEPRMIWKDMTR